MKNGLKQLVLGTSAITVTLAVVGCGNMPNGNVPFAGEQGVSYGAAAVPGEVIVRFRDANRQAAVLQKLGLRTVKKVERLNAVVVKGASKAAIDALNADKASVLYAEPNYIAKAIDFRTTAGDELLGDLWGMEKIEAAPAWAAVGAKTSSVTVAVVDTGIDYNHPDFGGRVDKGRDFINNDNDAMDDHYHGTHCAGTIAAGIGNGGVVGVAPNAKLIAVKVLSKSGSGSYDGVANGIIYAADRGADVISMSLGGPAGSKVIEDAVKYAMGKGSLVVAAMGNDNSERPSYPAAVPGVLAVGATQSNDTRASFSNFGKHISVAAPGHQILSTVPGGKYKVLSGTSMACPHTAGLAALVKAANPGLNAAGIRDVIEKSADDLGGAGFDKYFGHGRINAKKAVGLR